MYRDQMPKTNLSIIYVPDRKSVSATFYCISYISVCVQIKQKERNKKISKCQTSSLFWMGGNIKRYFNQTNEKQTDKREALLWHFHVLPI